MHERESFFTRGNSLVGAVLVVALLSAAAIAIDSAAWNPNQQALVAAGGNPALTPPTSSTPKETIVEKAGSQSTKCVQGYDYAVYEDGSKPIVSCRLVQKGCYGATTPQISVAGEKTKTQPCISTPEKYVAKMTLPAVARQCSSTWKCKYYHCSALYKEGCRLMGEAKEGESIGSQKVITSATSELKAEDIARLTEISKDSNAVKALSTGESQFASGLAGAYEQKAVEIQNQEIATTQADIQTKLAALETCQGDKAFVDPLLCQDKQIAVTAAQQKLNQQKLELEQLGTHAQRLKGQEISLTPATRPAEEELPDYCGDACEKARKAGSTFVTPPPEDPPCKGIMCQLGKYVDPAPSRAELYAACQGGNQRACDAYVGNGSGGGGASGGYGGARSSGGQPCGAQQQQQGGLLGTIMSLFSGGNKSGNGGCNSGNNDNDAPIPTCRITATPMTIPTGGKPVTLTWQSEKAFSATLSNTGNVSTQGSMTVNPQTTTTYTLSLGGFQDNRTGQQLRGQCSVQVVVGNSGDGGTGDGAVKAEISCRPEKADVGMSVAVSFACRNANTSVGAGFSTNNQMSGSATPVVAQPTIGSDSVTYGLTCSKEGKTDTAQCTVEINKATIVLIANPKNVESGKESNIGWITSGMESCTISSPTLSGFTAENAGSTSVSGVAKSPPLTTDTKFVLSCTTKAGGTKTAETTVKVGQ